jgi:hypothetical protein
LENVHWKILKANGKIKLDLWDIACDGDTIIAVAEKLCWFPQGL